MRASRVLVLVFLLVAAGTAAHQPPPALAGQSHARAALPAMKTHDYKLTITAEGVYRLTGAYLQSKGINIDGVVSSTLGISDGGVPVPIYVSSAGSSFDSTDFIEFYAHPVDTTYTSANVYILSDTVRKPARVAIAPIQTPRTPTGVGYAAFRDLRRVERLSDAPVHDPYTTSNAWPTDGDPHWYEASLLAGSQKGLVTTVSTTLSFEVYGLASSSTGPCSVVIPVWGITRKGKATTHRLDVAITGRKGVVRAVPGSPFRWKDTGSADAYTVHTTFPCTWLTENGASTVLNRLTLGTTVQRGTSIEQIVIRGMQLGYPRRLCALASSPQPAVAGSPISAEFDNVPLYTSHVARPPTSFTVAGFSGPPQTIWRLTNGVPTLLVGFSVVIGNGQQAPCPGGSYRISFGDTVTAPSRYFVTSEALVPASTGPLDTTNITAGGSASARYLMIAHPKFVAGLTPLVRYHRKQGFTVKVVSVGTIYDQFGHGQVNPEAIRSYITYAHDHLGTQYVLLAGGDTYDYHNYYGCPRSGVCDQSNLNNRSFIPSLYINSPYDTGLVASDTLLAVQAPKSFQVAPTVRWPTVAIGRLPVFNTAQLQIEVTKSTHWQGWVSRYRHTALYATGPSNAFKSASSLMVLPGFHPKTYDQTGNRAHDLALRASFLAALNHGQEIVNYVGDSSAVQWGRLPLLASGDIADLTNATRPSLVLQWSSGTADYTNPTVSTIDRALLASTDPANRPDGAALALGATGLSIYADDLKLAGVSPGSHSVQLQAANGMHYFYDYLAAGYSCGVSLQLAKQDLIGQRRDPFDVYTAQLYTILGDPALSLAGAPLSRLLHPMQPQIIRFVATRSHGSIALTWAVAASQTVTGYRLLRLDAHGVYRAIGPSALTTVHYADPSGRAGSRYQLLLLGAQQQVLGTALVQAH